MLCQYCAFNRCSRREPYFKCLCESCSTRQWLRPLVSGASLRGGKSP